MSRWFNQVSGDGEQEDGDRRWECLICGTHAFSDLRCAVCGSMSLKPITAADERKSLLKHSAIEELGPTPPLREKD
jgi:hypothetical protein